MAAFRPDAPRSFAPASSDVGTSARTTMPAPVSRLVAALRRLPGIGPKSAQRLAYHIVSSPEHQATELSEAVHGVKSELVECDVCADVTVATLPTCPVCSDDQRDSSVVCVVEEPLDVVAIERTRTYDGTYHVLHGVISPTNGIGPSDLKVAELLGRLRAEGSPVREVIVATNPNLDGEATAMHLQRGIEPLGIRVTRIARGLPSGSDIEFADDATLAHAISSRSEL